MDVAIILKTPELKDVVKEEYVIYADAGYKFKDKIGDKKVLSVVGDFDSLDAPPKDEKVITLNAEKDFTDGERAVILAKELGATAITIYGANGGRLDHILGNLTLLKKAKELGVFAKIVDNNLTIKLVSGKVKLKVKKDTALSFIPFGEKCVFESSKNLYYPLDNLTLTNGNTRGISNKTLSDKVEFNITFGESLVIFEE